MTTRMLIDARHPEETRVAVVKGNRIEEFDFEAAARKQIKGNIYLAKVTRVEPSLQAAFVDYGGNRHGFLAFSEIHPDYYQIPKEDREALLAEEQRLVDEHNRQSDSYSDDDSGYEADVDGGDEVEGMDGEPQARPEDHGNTEEAGAEALRRRRMALRRRYKIQDVIRRRQVLLVQVVKEERGNKGAALTSYISLAGRYSVLMPNTAQGGGISRKIANMADRKRLKSIMAELNLPSSMGAIVRTAGLERTKGEIKRDFDYLARLWDEIREKTMVSVAPALVYEDSDLVKRAIRDIYSREIDEVLVDGEEGYQQAYDFMRLLMPSHARKVQLYSDPVPLFHRAGVESQLAQLMNPVVTLKSGGYIVINPAEALVAIDVNSGRSTREYNIEETALKTNIEAAEEVARQLRLRDLAGLVVVDFIDMESNGNNRRVERALKDALKQDRARIQVGRISSFGLLEMSRQRLRTGVLEASTLVCPMCDGSGLVRTDGSAALAALRVLEEEIVKGRASIFRLRADSSVAVYTMNRKRMELAELEARYGVSIEVVPDHSLIGGRIAIDSSGTPPLEAPRMSALATPERFIPDPDEFDDEIEADLEEAENEREESREGREDRDERGGRERRRRRRRRGGRDRDQERDFDQDPEAVQERADARYPDEQADETPVDADSQDEAGRENGLEDERGEGEYGVEGEERDRRRRRRRRRRGGRREGGDREGYEAQSGEGANDLGEAQASEATDTTDVVADAAPEQEVAVRADKPKRGRRRPEKVAGEAVAAASETDAPAVKAAPVVSLEAIVEAATAAAQAEGPEAVAPVKKPRKRATAKATAEATAEVSAEAVAEAVVEAKPKATRTRKTAAQKAAEAAAQVGDTETVAAEAKPKATRTRKAAASKTAATEGAEAAPKAKAAAKPRSRKKAETVAAEPAPAAAAEPVAPAAPAPTAPATPAAAEPVADAPAPRRGWWQRTFGAEG